MSQLPANTITVLQVEKTQAFLRLSNGIEMWVPRAMLAGFGIKLSQLKVGATFAA